MGLNDQLGVSPADLGIALPPTSRPRRYVTTVEDAGVVTAWIGDCEIAWFECASELDAVRLESALKAEAKPRLTKE